MKTITTILIIIVSLYAGAYIGPSRLNKAAKITADKMVETGKVVVAYFDTEGEE